MIVSHSVESTFNFTQYNLDYLMLGEPPNDCKSGNLRIIGITEASKIKKGKVRWIDM